MDIRQFFSESEQGQIKQAIDRAEQKTSANIVPVLADASGRYDRSEDIFGLMLAILALVLAWIYLMGPAGSDQSWLSGTTPQLDPGDIGIAILVVICTFIAGVVLASKIWPIRKLFTPQAAMKACLEEGARQAFHEFSLSRTSGASGVMIYISLYERMVYVMGDDAVTDKLDKIDFETVRDIVINGFRTDTPAEGLCNAIAHFAEKLNQVLPATDSTRNELSNELRIWDRKL